MDTIELMQEDIFKLEEKLEALQSENKRLREENKELQEILHYGNIDTPMVAVIGRAMEEKRQALKGEK
jgi:cell division septum initiation protein DivIVA